MPDDSMLGSIVFGGPDGAIQPHDPTNPFVSRERPRHPPGTPRMQISREAMPIVEMTIRGMGEVVHHAIMLHAEDLGEIAQAAVKEAIAGFDWRAQIGDEVERQLTSQIKSRLSNFLWSTEGTALVDGVIARAIEGAFGAPETKRPKAR